MAADRNLAEQSAAKSIVKGPNEDEIDLNFIGSIPG